MWGIISLTIVQAKTKGKNKPQHKIWCILRWQWHFLFLAALLYRKPNNSLWLLVIRVGRKTEWIKSQCALVYWPTMELDSLLCNYFNVRVIWLLVAIWHLDWEQSLIFFFLHYCTQNLITPAEKPLAARNEGISPIKKNRGLQSRWMRSRTRGILREKAHCKQSIWHSAKHICQSPLTENTLRVRVLAHLQSFVSLLLCISATKTQWNRTSEFLGMCHGHWRPPVLCMAGYPAENGKCCKMYVWEKNNTVIIPKVLSEEECLVSLNPMFFFKWQEVSVNVGLWEG